jgi:hypothetical protein
MLSLSADITESDIDLKLVNGDESADAGDIEYGKVLMKFAEAIAVRDEAALVLAREELLREAGAEVLVDAAGVAGNFQRMVRIADSTGIPLDEAMAALSYGAINELNLDRFSSAKNTPPGGLKRKILNWIVRPLAKRQFKKMLDL